MPYKEHVAFSLPPNLIATIWRYQDLGRLLSVLQTRTLHFARGDTFSDPFEGSYPQANYKESREKSRGALREGINPHGFANAWRLKCAVNCWHMLDDESAAMWALYGRSDTGVAIRSTVSRLVESIKDAPQDVFISPVKYIDYDRTPIPEDNTLYPLIHKRRSFTHESELRAITIFPTPPGTFDLTSLPRGLAVPVAIETLIEAVLVAPDAPQWFLSTVQRAVRDSGFPGIQVLQSRIGEKPLF